MDRLSLKFFPDPCLSRPCEAVEAFGPELERIAQEMLRVMRDAQGVGLAANQVGLGIRLVVMDGAATGAAEDWVLANPRVLRSEGAGDMEEGCLSLPGVRCRIVARAGKVAVAFQDAMGRAREETFEGLEALCVQHEIDHLDGLTMLDRMSPLKASRAKAKMGKKAGRP